MLTRIEVRNLACFSDAPSVLNLAPETIIIGPNNVGKSAVIAGFNALHLSYHNGSWVSAVSGIYQWNRFEDMVHRHETGREVHLRATFVGQTWSGTVSAIVTQSAQAQFTPQRAGNVLQELGKVWYLGPSRTALQREIQVANYSRVFPWQPINPDGSNVIPYLLERFTERDTRWDEAENWLKHVAPELSVLKVPLRMMQTSVETTDARLGIDINMALQGTGVQKALSVIAAVVFSPEGSTIIIEEPEIHLHPRSQEALADLFNKAVNEWNKQIVFVTHSWEMLLPFVSDVGPGQGRGQQHPRAVANKFKLVVFNPVTRDGRENIDISDLDISHMDFMTLRDYLKKLWG